RAKQARARAYALVSAPAETGRRSSLSPGHGARTAAGGAASRFEKYKAAPSRIQSGRVASRPSVIRCTSSCRIARSRTPRSRSSARGGSGSRPVTREAEPVARAPDIEGGALDVLPPERAPDGDAQILTADLIGPQTVEPDPRDAAGPRARDYARVAQTLAPEAGRAQRAHEIGVAQFRRPLWHAPTCLVIMRRQERWT